MTKRDVSIAIGSLRASATTRKDGAPELALVMLGTPRSASVVSSSGNALWTVIDPGGGGGDLGTSASSSGGFDLLLFPPGYGAALLRLSAQDGELGGFASTYVRAVDTTAPSPTSNGLVFDLGCGTSRIRDIYVDLCNPRQFSTTNQSANLSLDAITDTCDSTPIIHVTGVYAFDESGTQIQYAQCPSHPAPSTDPSVRYDVVWYGEDAWGNQTATQRTRLTIKADPGATECSGGTHFKSHVVWTGNNASASAPENFVKGTYDFTLLTPGGVTMPSGVALTRGSSATVRISDHEVVTSGIGSNVARVGNDGAGHIGLVVEESRTNLIASARSLAGTGWSTGSGVTTTTSVTGVDGTSAATESAVSSGGWSNYTLQSVLTYGDRYTYSQWVRNASGSGPIQAYVEYGGAVVVSAESAGSSVFHRLVLSGTAGGTTFVAYPIDGYDDSAYGGLTSGARDNVTDLIQLEAGGFATEAIVTTSGTASRSADRLYVSSGGSLLDSGRLNFEIRLQPKGASSDYPGWVDLWDIGSAYASLYVPSGVLYIVNGTDVNYVTGISWSAGDSLDFYVAAGGGMATVVQWRANEGTVSVPTVAGTALGSFTISGALDVASFGSGYQFSAYVQQFRGWNSGATPTWVQ